MAKYCVYSGGNGSSGTFAGNAPTAGEWATAYASLSAAISGKVAGDIFYVHDQHVANYGASTTLSGPATGYFYVYSIDHTTSADATLLAGGKENTNGNFYLSITGSWVFHGMSLVVGSNASQSGAILYFENGSSVDSVMKFTGCTLQLNTTHSVPDFTWNAKGSYRNAFVLENCTSTFGATGQYYACNGVGMEFKGCTFTGSVTSLFKPSGNPVTLLAYGCDMSNATNVFDVSSGVTPAYMALHNCNTPSGISTGTHPGPGTRVIEAHSCVAAAGADHLYGYYYQDGTGTVQDNETYYLTGGAQIKDQDGAMVGYSLAMAPNTTYCSTQFPLYSPWQSVHVPATGSKTFTMHVTYDSATVAKDCELFLELEYYGSTTTPLSTVTSSAPLVSGTTSRDVLAAGSNLSTDSGSTWNGTFTNPQKHALAITATVNQIGMARCRVGYTKASGATVYVDNQIKVS